MVLTQGINKRVSEELFLGNDDKFTHLPKVKFVLFNDCYENHIFAGMSVCVCVCAGVGMKHFP